MCEDKQRARRTEQFPHLEDVYDQDLREEALAFAEEFKAFLDLAKTERDAVEVSIEAAQELGFRPLTDCERLQPGDKVYHNIKNKGLVLAVLGERPVEEGFRILGAHIDSPRLDLKPNSISEEQELVYFRTHYYGGIKKYQWTAIPLALHGVVINGEGERIRLSLGEAEDEPKFLVTDLLPHLGAEQMSKKASEIIPGEALSLLAGCSPELADGGLAEGASRFREGLLSRLEADYGIRERDLYSAELSAVPATKAFDLGLDRRVVASYGLDDKICAYPALQAVLAQERPKYTAVCLLSDKEEVGSAGNSGAQSRCYENVLAEILYRSNPEQYSELRLRRCLEATVMLSADVTNAYDPNFASVSDKTNSHYMGHGISLCKYTGARGKSGASDASAELMSAICRLLDSHGICWQTGEMGKVDAGGGGTIAKYFAGTGMEVLDCGVPVLSMHAPIEQGHKFDIYETYRAYRCFLEQFEAL